MTMQEIDIVYPGQLFHGDVVQFTALNEEDETYTELLTVHTVAEYGTTHYEVAGYSDVEGDTVTHLLNEDDQLSLMGTMAEEF